MIWLYWLLSDIDTSFFNKIIGMCHECDKETQSWTSNPKFRKLIEILDGDFRSNIFTYFDALEKNSSFERKALGFLLRKSYKKIIFYKNTRPYAKQANEFDDYNYKT